jgi:hypothetical protein
MGYGWLLRELAANGCMVQWTIYANPSSIGILSCGIFWGGKCFLCVAEIALTIARVELDWLRGRQKDREKERDSPKEGTPGTGIWRWPVRV